MNAPMKHTREEALTLGILEAIDTRSDVTQRHLADTLGVALGLANSYLRRCVRKGLVKITQAPANRYLYYLTPQGFAEKSRLTAEYLGASFDFYRRASDSVVRAFRECEERGASRLLFAGVSELAEIGYVRMHDFALTTVGTFDPAHAREVFLARPVWRSLAAAEAFDVAVLTALQECAAMHAALVAEIGAERVVVPAIVQPLTVTAAPG
jgi:DNA-binding MarR family transcriptional regulator